MEDEEADQTADEDPAAAAAEAAGDLRDDPSNRIGNGEKLDPVEKEIDRREATAAPLLKAPPPSPEADAMAADKTQAAPPKHHHQHLRSGSAKNMARHSVLERSLSSRMAEIAPPDPKRSRGTEVEEPEDGGGGGGKCASWKRRWCKCMVAFAGDCAALCCCPCTILHLLALVCIRLPLTLLYGGCSRLRSRWRWHWRQWRRWWRSWRQWNNRQSKRRMSVTSSFSADIGEAVVAVAAALGGGGGGGEARHSQHHQRRPSFNAWPFGEPLVIDFPPYPGGFGDARHWGFFDSASDGSGGSPKKAHSLSSSTANPQSWEQQQQHQRHQQQQEQEQQQNDYSQDSG